MVQWLVRLKNVGDPCPSQPGVISKTGFQAGTVKTRIKEQAD